MSFDPQAFNPTNAPERESTPFTNIGRVKVNSIRTAAEVYGQSQRGIPVGMEPSDPIWMLEYEALDAKFPDGNGLRLGGALKLLESTATWQKRGDGKARRFVSKGDRANLVSTAYNGLGIVVYPADPNYDESKVIGEVFSLDMIEQKNKDGEKLGSSIPIPTRNLGTNFIYTGKVRVVTPKGAVGMASNGASAPMTRDIATDAALREALIAALGGVDVSDTDAVVTAIKVVTPLGGLLLAGKGVGGMIVSETIGEALVEAGLITA